MLWLEIQKFWSEILTIFIIYIAQLPIMLVALISWDILIAFIMSIIFILSHSFCLNFIQALLLSQRSIVFVLRRMAFDMHYWLSVPCLLLSLVVHSPRKRIYGCFFFRLDHFRYLISERWPMNRMRLSNLLRTCRLLTRC